MRYLPVLLLAALPAWAIDDIRVYAAGGKSITNWHGQADVQSVQVEMGKALSPRTTIGFAVAPILVWQPRSWFGDQYGDGNESVHALATTFLVRRSFRVDKPVQFYLQCGTGPMLAKKRVPAATSRFNFASEVTAGMVFNRDGRFPFIAAYRFIHISNGGYASRNPGLNVSAAVIGVQIRSPR